MSQKRYMRYLIGAIALFIGYHLFVWTFFTSKIFDLDDKTTVGDLARMSYQIDMLVPKKLRYTLPKSFIYDKTFKNQKIDLITIGDSFSHAACGGLNPYYQDFLASYYNINVLNVNPVDSMHFIETAALLSNKGFLKKTGTKYLLIQSVERILTDRFAKEIDLSPEDQNITISKKIFTVKHLPVKIISTANYKVLYYSIAYKFKENAQKNIYRLTTSKQLFSLPLRDVLIFHDDIRNIPLFTKKNVQKLNANLNKLAHFLKKQNVKLIFMPTPDKYDLYYDYLAHNKHPQNPFFDLIRPMKKDYIFIDTKKILQPYLQKGIKDIYYVDDTHWSYKASEAIAKSKEFKKIFQK